VGVEAMRNGATLIAQKAAEIAGDLPVILTGDFNVTPDSEAYKAILAGGFADMRFLAASTDPGRTYHGFTGADGLSTIDHIFIKGNVKPGCFYVDRTKRDGRFPSDPFPVFAEIEI
jgi:endonuclease/exonuclease/phosphatase family metal-dependent hydrolase